MAKGMACDVLIVGGGTGGCAAAMAATSLGLSVVVTEETDWIGGQLTSQLVPPDEHPWIERFGCTARYRAYREGVRAYYRDHRPLTQAARADATLNPGSGWVSRLCHEPKIGLAVLDSMLELAIGEGKLQVLLETAPIAADVKGDTVHGLRVLDKRSGEQFEIRAKMVLDATELGDLLSMTGAEYRVGAESKRQTKEPNALDGEPDPNDVQGLTWCFAMAHDPGSHRVIDRPHRYEWWRAYAPSNWVGNLLDFTSEHPYTGEKRWLPLFGETPDKGGLFTYRQIVDPSRFEEGSVSHAVTVVNWPQNDYFVASILDVSESDKAARLAEAKELSLALLYWLQTEAPRHDGGTGYPGLYLRPDIAGTSDGFAKAVYVRESRRMEAQFMVTESHVASYTNPGLDRAPSMPRSVGVGSYRIDLHPSTSGARTIDTPTLPFEIPLGSLLPVRMRNLLPACKNLGVTHIANGCYRLHPVEWNVGEAAGLLAGFSILRRVAPAEVGVNEGLWQDFQGLLSDQGIETAWPASLGRPE